MSVGWTSFFSPASGLGEEAISLAEERNPQLKAIVSTMTVMVPLVAGLKESPVLNLDLWLAFVFAAAVVLIIPGPTIILVISQSLAHGRRAVLPQAAGVTLGDFTAMSMSLLGLGAVLASSAVAFTVLKWIGAIYLISLGLRLWKGGSGESRIRPAVASASRGSLFRSAFVVTALNPKSIAFFVAFFPQFISTQNHAFPQFLVLGSTFLTLAALNAILYGVFAGRLRDAIQNPKVRRCFDLCGGTALILAGVATASVQRSS